MELCGSAKLVDGLVEEAEGVTQRMREVVWRIDEGGRALAQDAEQG